MWLCVRSELLRTVLQERYVLHFLEALSFGTGQNLTGKRSDVADCWAFPDNIGTNKGQGILQEAPDLGPCE